MLFIQLPTIMLKNTDLVVGANYFVAQNYVITNTTLTPCDVGVLIPCVFVGFGKNNQKIFKTFEDETLVATDGNYSVYESYDAFFVDLVVGVSNFNENSKENSSMKKFNFDECLKNMILESQEKHPEIWI